MSKRLVIVESPTKAKTVKKILGAGYEVTSSFGHIRDLPRKTMGVDIENDYTPEYVVSDDKKERVAALKKLAKAADEIFIATDDDREGEAIGWHLANVLKIDPKKAKRIVFHEITKPAIEKAMKNPRHIDFDLVDAQQARRVLDRLVGYELSPFLWKKVARGLSAGRVQSVAMRFIVEREREREAFDSVEYWSLEATFNKNKKDFEAKLATHKGEKITKMDIKDEKQAKSMTKDLLSGSYTVESIEKKTVTKTPKAPYRTSTLQQDANTRLGYSSKQTMRLAQQLYEGVKLGKEGMTGLITYMRTDSQNLSETFLEESNTFVHGHFGPEYALDKPRVFTKKTKGAQEAHEAIRPTDPARTPESLEDHLDARQLKVYDLIWRRAVSTQMADAKLTKEKIILNSKPGSFRVTGSLIAFDGYLKLYPDTSKENILPPMKEGDAVDLKSLEPKQHFTEPPARYSDATLVKELEEHGIGRPSTYSPTISTVIDRGYVDRDDNKRLFPTDIAYIVNDLLVEHFKEIVDKEFTAHMEANFDKIEEGKAKWVPIIDKFYKPFHKNLEKKDKEIDKKELTEETTDEKCEKCKSDMIIKVGRFGKFMACTNYPECKNTVAINRDGSVKVEVEPEVLGKDPETGLDVTIRTGRFGPYIQLGEKVEGSKEKPKRGSLLRGMKAEDVDFGLALKLLSLPRSLGEWKGEEITAQVGRFGPYIKAGEESRSISAKQTFTVLDITHEQAVELLNIPKKTRKRKAG
ncbi:MAG TPA: type I DNA topoisomerase [Patescibacteria group bacterium]|nr:type I DNA topoisomerase [Patescibacteria group bacterium]